MSFFNFQYSAYIKNNVFCFLVRTNTPLVLRMLLLHYSDKYYEKYRKIDIHEHVYHDSWNFEIQWWFQANFLNVLWDVYISLLPSPSPWGWLKTHDKVMITRDFHYIARFLVKNGGIFPSVPLSKINVPQYQRMSDSGLLDWTVF